MGYVDCGNNDNKAGSMPLRKLVHAIYRDFFSASTIENFIGKNLIFFLFLLET